MKKKLTAAALAAGLLLLTGCAAQTVTPFTAYWQQNTSVYDRSFYETLHYSVSFDRSENFRSGFIFEPGEGCSYTVTTEAVPAWNGRSQLYRLTSSLTLLYVYLLRTKRARSSLSAARAATNLPSSSAPCSSVPPSAITSNPSAARAPSIPIPRSNRTAREVAVYSYSYSVSYTEDGDEASVTYTDHFAGLTEAESTINENTRKVSVFAEEILPEGEVSVSGIQKPLHRHRRGAAALCGPRPLLFFGERPAADRFQRRKRVHRIHERHRRERVLRGRNELCTGRRKDGGRWRWKPSSSLRGWRTAARTPALCRQPSTPCPPRRMRTATRRGTFYFALPLEVRQAFGFAGYCGGDRLFAGRGLARPSRCGYGRGVTPGALPSKTNGAEIRAAIF